MVKPPIVWGTLSFREEGRPDQKKKHLAQINRFKMGGILKYFFNDLQNRLWDIIRMIE